MDFTREPIIESVITPREGFKLVVRASRGTGQEDYFVDAVEIVTFGNSQFFRSVERPKSFLVPVTDYEVLEVRETRMILKNVGIDRSIKIGGGREAPMRSGREEKGEETVDDAQKAAATAGGDKKREGKRTRHRRRRGREDRGDFPREEGAAPNGSEEKVNLPAPRREGEEAESPAPSSSGIASLLPPPTTLISETIARYKDNALFKGAFYVKEEKEEQREESMKESVDTSEGGYPSLDVIDEQIDHPIIPESKLSESEEESQKKLWNFSENDHS